MLEMDFGVVKGMTIVKLTGELTSNTFYKFNEEVDYSVITEAGKEISDITNLQTTLNGKAASSHSHTFASITSRGEAFLS